jgi:hypothetical protein
MPPPHSIFTRIPYHSSSASPRTDTRALHSDSCSTWGPRRPSDKRGRARGAPIRNDPTAALYGCPAGTRRDNAIEGGEEKYNT